jgi:hypothetical protein
VENIELFLYLLIRPRQFCAELKQTNLQKNKTTKHNFSNICENVNI